MEKIMYPLKNMWITCIPGQYLHKYSQALDDQGLNYATSDKVYAPFTGKVIRKYPSECEIWFESVDKVEFADGTIDYATILFAHKDNYEDIKENVIYKQGEVIYSEGTRASNKIGGADRHVHFEICAGKTTGSGWVKAQDGTWNLKNGKSPSECYFINEGINVIKTGGLTFKRLKTTTEPVERNENINQIRIIVDSLRIRSGHSTNDSVLGFAENEGIYNDLEVYSDGTYTWHRIADNEWVADNGEWLELLLRKQTQEEILEEENKKLKSEIEKLETKIATLNNEIVSLKAILQEINKLSGGA